LGLGAGIDLIMQGFRTIKSDEGANEIIRNKLSTLSEQEGT